LKKKLITFVIHKEQFSFQVHPLRITIKLDIGEIWAGFSPVKSGSFHMMRREADS